MFAKISYDSPVGVLTVAADEKGIVALTIAGQKYEDRHLPSEAEERETPVLKAARLWLDRYFAGKKPAPDTLPLEAGLREEFDWYKDHPDSVYKRNPYMEYIDNHL